MARSRQTIERDIEKALSEITYHLGEAEKEKGNSLNALAHETASLYYSTVELPQLEEELRELEGE